MASLAHFVEVLDHMAERPYMYFNDPSPFALHYFVEGALYGMGNSTESQRFRAFINGFQNHVSTLYRHSDVSGWAAILAFRVPGELNAYRETIRQMQLFYADWKHAIISGQPQSST